MTKTDKLFSQKEREILSKFTNGNTVSENDEFVLNRYAGIGFVKTGFNWDTMEPTAKLTKLGLKHLNR